MFQHYLLILTALGTLSACYVSWLHQDWSVTGVAIHRVPLTQIARAIVAIKSVTERSP
jgi:hypothetical protein